MKNLIACRPSSFHPYTDRAYPALQQLNLRNVEITAPRPAELKSVQEELERYGLRATSTALVFDNGDAAFFERAAESMESAAALGAPIMFTSQKAGDAPRPEVYGRLRRLGDLAAAKNIVVVIETHPDLGMNGSTALATMQGVDHPNIRINFDPANIYYYNENVDAVTELTKILPYVAAVHLKDSAGGFQEHNFPAIGDGAADWKTIFKLLNDRGMYGPFTLEMEGIAGETLTFEQTYARIERSLEFLRGCGLME